MSKTWALLREVRESDSRETRDALCNELRIQLRDMHKYLNRYRRIASQHAAA